MRKILFGILLSVLMVFSSIADDITCAPGTELLVPNEYMPLEYIESTGTQWIELPQTFRNTDEMVAQVAMLTSSNDKYFVSPSQWNTNKNRFALGGSYKSRFHFGYGDTATDLTMFLPSTKADFEPHTYTYKDYTFKMEDLGLSADVSRIGFGGETRNLRLFYGYNAPTACKIYKYRHVRSEQELIDFVPVRRNSDGAVGMYDKVEGKFYGNDGTGKFIAGPDVDSMCPVCSDGYYNDTGNNTSCVQCPAGYVATGANASNHDSINDCKITCGGGFYLSSQYGTECIQTGVGYWSPSHTYGYGDMGIRNQCPDGLTTIGFGAGADEVGDCGMKFHVGDGAIYLRSERKTTPTLNVEYGGRVFYGNMDSYTIPMNVDTTRKLHVEYNDIVYSVHDDSTDLYEFDSDGRLVGASDNIYIESTGTQYIDTGYFVNQNTAWCLNAQKTGSDVLSLGYINGQSGSIACNYYSGPQWAWYSYRTHNILPGNNKFNVCIIDKQLLIDGVVRDTQTSSNVPDAWIAPATFALFGVNRGNTVTTKSYRIYSFYIKEGTEYKRNFVPVPAGMVINGYVVPSNGMWDIVEQKFYGNSGTGEFIYGVD